MRTLIFVFVAGVAGIIVLLLATATSSPIGTATADVALSSVVPSPDDSADTAGSIATSTVDADSLAKGYAKAERALTSPALEERKAQRRALQQSGYASVLADVIRLDGVGALLSAMRMNAQIQFFMSHQTLYIYVRVKEPEHAARPYDPGRPSGPYPIALSDDWSMPEDPWR